MAFRRMLDGYYFSDIIVKVGVLSFLSVPSLYSLNVQLWKCDSPRKGVLACHFRNTITAPALVCEPSVIFIIATINSCRCCLLCDTIEFWKPEYKPNPYKSLRRLRVFGSHAASFSLSGSLPNCAFHSPDTDCATLREQSPTERRLFCARQLESAVGKVYN